MNFKYSLILCLVLICGLTLNTVSANEIDGNHKISAIHNP